MFRSSVNTQDVTPSNGLGRRFWVVALHLFFATVVAVSASVPGGLVESPLKPEAFPREGTRFVSLPPGETGIHAENRYDDPRMRGELAEEFDSSSIGTGVAIGDYDGDGLPDIFVVNKTGSCRLFRNRGDWKFEDVTEKSGVGGVGDAALTWKQGAAWADVNNDGLLDLYICRFNAPNLLYINQGDGTFREEAAQRGLAVKDSSVMASFCDYDRDGWLDVYITTNLLNAAEHPEGQRGYLFHNNRDGTFTDVTERAGISGQGQSHSATWWDYDNDGWPDLYVSYDYGIPDKLYHNNRDGTFTDTIDQAVPHTSFSSMGADIGDVNNDGLIDFLVADMAATTHAGDQHFLADARSKTETRADLASRAPKYHRNALLLGTGTSHCLEAANLAGVAATDWTWSVRLEDLDNDGLLDLFVTNGFHHSPGVDLIGKLTSAATLAERREILNASPVQTEANIALRNLGDLRFENCGKAWGLDQIGVSFGTALGDLDGDGDLDIVYTNFRGEPTVLRNESGPNHRVTIALRGTVSNRFGIGSIVRLETAQGAQVRVLTLARGYLSTSEPMVHFGLGQSNAILRLTVVWPSGIVQSFADLAVDRHFVVTEPATESAQTASPAPTGQFVEASKVLGLNLVSLESAADQLAPQRLVPFRLNHRGPALAISESPVDGRLAIAIGGTPRSPLRVMLEKDKGGFSAVEPASLLPASNLDDGPLLWLDSGEEGRATLLVTKSGDRVPVHETEYQPRLYVGAEPSRIQEVATETLPLFPVSVGAMAAADFDRDGRLDLFVGGRNIPGQYPAGARSALWRNQAGKYSDVTERVAPRLRNLGMVTAALWSDIDGDGWPDLIVAVEWGQILYFHNHLGERFEDWTERAGFSAAGTGWWTSLAAADFNHDGRPDIVAGNVGLNTQYQPSPAQPAVLLWGDLRGDGSTQLLEGYYEGETLFPWRARRDLGAVFPSILKRYPKNDDFGRATLAEIFGAGKLAQAHRLAATELRSGVFLSQPDGTYRFVPLPRIAQISPLQGMVAGDFNGDGNADIYAVQNSYAPIPAIGRFDGGLSQLLLGDGAGNFAAVPPGASKLIVPGDAKALAVVDLDRDGWPDFIVTQNNGPTLAFRNLGVPGHHSLQVKLQGAEGNRQAIGAVVTLELSDHTTQTAEIYSGSGYFSQSPAACFFGYTDSNSPLKIRVRWPSGRLSEHPIPAGAVVLTLKLPGGK